MLYGDGKVPPGEIDVTFAIPTRDWSATISRPTINFYLYDISENIKLRDSAMTRVRSSTTEAQRLRPRHIDLKYVVTVHFKSQLAELEQQEWEVLWRVLATLMRNSSWPSSMVPQEALALDSELQAYVAYPEGAPRQGEIWTTLGTSPRPSLHYVLTAPLDLNIEYLKTLVVELRVGLSDMSGGLQASLPTRYGWTLLGPAKEPLAGAEVRVPEVPGFSLSAENGVFTTQLPHAEVTQLMVRPAGEGEWRLVSVVPGSYDVVLPGADTGSTDAGTPIKPGSGPTDKRA